MPNAVRLWCTILGVLLCLGCQNMGSNSSYLLKYKKDLRGFYENPQKSNEVKSWLTSEAESDLPRIYLTNIPLSLSDHYDTRNPDYMEEVRAINQGDPVNIVINKVHLANNAEWLCFKSWCPDTAEIAVVVSVDDGKEEEPKNVIVAYEEGLKSNINLPIGDLLAYANGAYDNQPLRIAITVFEFDQLENENFKKMLGTAAGIGAAFTPAYAPAWSMATQVGNFLISQNKDDVVVKFTFQLYPKTLLPSKSVVGTLGMPRIQSGSYIIFNTKCANIVTDPKEEIHVDFDLTAHKVSVPRTPSDRKVLDGKTLPDWPIAPASVQPSTPFEESYVVLTVGKSPTRSAATIIDRLNVLNRKATGLQSLELRSEAGAALLGRDLDDIRSAVTWYFAEGEYAGKKTDSRALAEIFRLVDDPRLNETDRRKAVNLISRSLPSMSNTFKTTNHISKEQERDIANMKAWYEVVRAQAMYDAGEDRLVCKDSKGKEVDCQ